MCRPLDPLGLWLAPSDFHLKPEKILHDQKLKYQAVLAGFTPAFNSQKHTQGTHETFSKTEIYF